MTNKEKLYKIAGFRNDIDAISYGLCKKISCDDCPVGEELKCKTGSCRENIKNYLSEDDKNGKVQ